VDGAVYKPEDVIDPALAGVSVQRTPEFVASPTVAVNCWVWEDHRLADGGVIVTVPCARIWIALMMAHAPSDVS
jgi:hypothetical protein